MAEVSHVSTTLCPTMEQVLFTAVVIATQRRKTKLFSPRPRSHFTRLHGQKTVRHVPRPPRGVINRHRRFTRHLQHPNIYSNTDRKPFDIKLLVFRRKSHRNFLFYTRRKNYFHIRLPIFLQARAVNPLSEVCLVLFRCFR